MFISRDLQYDYTAAAALTMPRPSISAACLWTATTRSRWARFAADAGARMRTKALRDLHADWPRR